MRGFLDSQPALLLSLLVALLTPGCLSSQSATDTAASRAAALGTWQYQVTGRAPLHRGVFRITSKDGHLQALVRDERRGRFTARVRVNNSRMELTLGQLRISGQIKDGSYSGFLHLDQWDVSAPNRSREQWSASPTASLFAERVQSGVMAGVGSGLECESILREANGCS